MAGSKIRTLKIALAGNPNCGKSTLFNSLTGLNQKISNFSGTTIDKKTGKAEWEGVKVSITDLPGTFSIYPKSPDERVASDMLVYEEMEDAPDCVIIIADATHLKRSLLLTTQITDIGFPAVLALNMVDLAEKRNLKIDVNQLSQLLAIPVVIINARKGTGVEQLKHTILETKQISRVPFYDINQGIIPFLEEFNPYIKGKTLYHQLVKVHRTGNTIHDEQNIYRIFDKYEYNANELQQRETIQRFKKADYIIAKCLSTLELTEKIESGYKMDKIFCHPFWGLISFSLIMLIVFQSVFTLAEYPKMIIEEFFTWIGRPIASNWGGFWYGDLLTEGILSGLGGMFSFLPQIAILFAFISVLEDSGYMSRVSFIADSIMRKFGLSGKSVVPLMGGLACAVPSIMATRNMENNRDRLITMMVTPLMSCSARLPVYSLLISLFTNDIYIWGVLSLRALILLGMYLVGFLSAILLALILTWFVSKSERGLFAMDIPVYKWPSLKNLKLTVYERCKTFVSEAGLIIVMISVLLWFAGSYGPADDYTRIRVKYSHSDERLPEMKNQMKAELLEYSYAGYFGKAIEPVITPLGFDWKIGISIITSFAAREVFVGTMSTLYSIGEENQESDLRVKLLQAKNPETGKPVYTIATVLSLMFFYAFALQCSSTILVVFKETSNWKWPVLQFTIMGIMAYFSSLVVFHVFQ